MRHPNHRLVKTHRTYTVEEIASLFHVHRNTVREWVKRGLPTCDDRRPMLILGPELAAFLQARRLKNRQTCSPGELYCVRCRAPRVPAGNMADYQPKTASLGNLIGICSSVRLHDEPARQSCPSWSRLGGRWTSRCRKHGHE